MTQTTKNTIKSIIEQEEVQVQYIQGYQVVHSWLLEDVMKTVTEIIAIKHDLQEV